LQPEDRAAIEKAWQAPIHNLWGSTEIGVQAVSCGHGEGLHICEDEVILERVDDDGIPVAPDAPAARTLATGLAGATFPFIRYDLGDQITLLPDECPCGSAFARVADVSGRRDDDFTYGAISLPATVFRYVLGTDPRIVEYQVVQTPGGAEIFVVGNPDMSALQHALTAATRTHGFADAVIDIRLVERLERHHATGKLKRFVPLR
jgi:phenylacetate-CoA ligase